MERGPLPPHERTWRHPSELAAEERAIARAQSPAPSTRLLALTTGTIGLLAVGVLILTVTPRRLESPIAISATTTPAASLLVAPSTNLAAARSTPRPPAFAGRRPVATAATSVHWALATPIGDGQMALITSDAIEGQEGTDIQVRLRSGQTGTAHVIDKIGEAWLVEPQHVEPGHQIALRQPTGSGIVTVLATPPVTIAFAELTTLDLHEGTAVLDADGNLVGICTRRPGDGQIRLIRVRAELVGAMIADR